jgi:hypothetical protein
VRYGVTDRGIVGLGEASYAFPAEIIEREFAPVLRKKFDLVSE